MKFFTFGAAACVLAGVTWRDPKYRWAPPTAVASDAGFLAQFRVLVWIVIGHVVPSHARK